MRIRFDTGDDMADVDLQIRSDNHYTKGPRRVSEKLSSLMCVLRERFEHENLKHDIILIGLAPKS